jgi:hypothetical protein
LRGKPRRRDISRHGATPRDIPRHRATFDPGVLGVLAVFYFFPSEKPVEKFFATGRDKVHNTFSETDLYLTAEHAENAESFMAHRTNGVIPNVPHRDGGIAFDVAEEKAIPRAKRSRNDSQDVLMHEKPLRPLRSLRLKGLRQGATYHDKQHVSWKNLQPVWS